MINEAMVRMIAGQLFSSLPERFQDVGQHLFATVMSEEFDFKEMDNIIPLIEVAVDAMTVDDARLCLPYVDITRTLLVVKAIPENESLNELIDRLRSIDISDLSQLELDNINFMVKEYADKFPENEYLIGYRDAIFIELNARMEKTHG